MIDDWLSEAERVPSISSLLKEFRDKRDRSAQPEFHYHPLGFTYANLAREGRVAIRLHVWSELTRAQEPVWDIHDHIFGFLSLVMAGRSHNECFEFEPDSEGDVGLFKVDYDEHASVLTSLGRLGYLRKTEECLIDAGELYAITANQLHRTTPCAPFVATLLRTEQHAGKEAVVIGSTQHPFSVAYRREQVDSVASDTLFNRLISEIEVAHNRTTDARYSDAESGSE
jgi:hypothetical protein